MRAVDSTGLLRLTSDGADKGSPAWSGEGSSIAFLRYGRAADNGVFIVPAAGGVERQITSVTTVDRLFDRHLDYSPVNDDLAIADKPTAEAPFAIHIASPGKGGRRRLTTPPPGSRGDTGPTFSPDGRSIAFRRTLSASVNDLHVVLASGGDPRQITSDRAFISAHAWTADGRELVFCSNRQSRSRLWRVAVSGGVPRPVPNIGEGANFLAISRSGQRLAYSVWSADTNVWRFAISGSQPDPGRPLIASTRTDISPHQSPDGSKIAFRSDRGGASEIWISGASGENPRQLTSLRGPLIGSPRWSPDSRQVAFDSRPAGNSHVFVVPASGGIPVQITAGPHDNALPSWSNDGRWLYFASNRSGSWEVWRVDAQPHAGPDGAVQITRQGGFRPLVSVDGRFVYYAKGQNTDGLWRVPVDGGAEEPVVSALKAGMWGQWDVSRTGIYLASPDADLLRLDPQGHAAIVRHLAKAPIFGDSGLAVSPDGKNILYVQSDRSGSDIFLVERFR